VEYRPSAMKGIGHLQARTIWNITATPPRFGLVFEVVMTAARRRQSAGMRGWASRKIVAEKIFENAQRRS
jgi:hypothetical protein